MSQSQRAGEVLAKYLIAAQTFLPLKLPRDPIQKYAWSWMAGILELAFSVTLLVSASKILAARGVMRALLEAYAKFAWAIEGKDDKERQHRFLMFDNEWVKEYRGTFEASKARGVPLPSNTEENIQARESGMKAAATAFGIKNIGTAPGLQKIMDDVGGPMMYWSFRVLSDAIHPSSGIVNDIADLSKNPVVIGEANPVKIAEALETTLQCIEGAFDVGGNVIGFDKNEFHKQTRDFKLQIEKEIRDLISNASPERKEK